MFFFLLFINTLLLGYYIYQPQISMLFQSPSTDPGSNNVSQSVLNTPMTISPPIPQCVGLTLQIGSLNWQIESIEPESDGSVNIPGNTPGMVYWIRNPDSADIFALSPTQANLDLFANMQAGQVALLTTQDCDRVEFSLSAPQPGEPGQVETSILPASSIIVYIPNSSLAPGQYAQGNLSEVYLPSLADAYPAPADPQADISLTSISILTGGAHLQIVISILNNGVTPITFTSDDFSLLSTGESPLALIQSYPSLPVRISPDEKITFNLVFPRPSTPTSTLKIYSTSYPLNGY